MNPRIITIAAAAAFTAIGFAAPASATSLGAPVHTIGQTVAQTIAQDGDSQVLLVGKKHGKKHGKWHGKHGKHGKWHGKNKWHGKHYGYYPAYHGLYAPYNYGGCYQQMHVQIGGHYVLQTVNIC
jgi:hypothetical protein